MKKHIVCLGDSNTHGYCADPADCADGGIRFNESERWTHLLQQKLGGEDLVIEEGLSGRTTCFDDPIHEGRNAREDVYASAACIAIGMARLVKKAMATECWGDKKPNILVVCPPPIGEGMLQSPVADTMGNGCVVKSKKLAHYYKEQCDLIGCHFVDAGDLGCEFNQVDFMHLTKRGHATLAQGLAELVPQLVK